MVFKIDFENDYDHIEFFLGHVLEALLEDIHCQIFSGCSFLNFSVLWIHFFCHLVKDTLILLIFLGLIFLLS